MSQKLKQYKQIRKTLNLSLKLQLYFSMLQNTLAQNIKNIIFFSNKKFDQPIAQILLKFTQQQKSQYLLQMIKFIKIQYNNWNKSNKKIQSNTKIQNNKIDCNRQKQQQLLTKRQQCKQSSNRQISEQFNNSQFNVSEQQKKQSQIQQQKKQKSSQISSQSQQLQKSSTISQSNHQRSSQISQFSQPNLSCMSFPSLSTSPQLISIIQTSAYFQQSKLKISYWHQVRFKLNKLQRYIQITSKKKSFKINLRLYLIRKSHNVNYCIVFHTLKDNVPNQMKNMHFILQKQVFNVLYQEIYTIVIKSRKQQLLQIIKEEEQNNLQKNNSSLTSKHQSPAKTNKNNNINDKINHNIDKTLVFLSYKSITKYQKYRDNIIKRLQVGKFDFQPQLSQQLYQHPFIKKFKLQRSQRAPNLFKLQVYLTKPQQIIKNQFIQAYKHKFKYILLQKILQVKDKYQAIYQRFLLKNNKVHEVISIRECFIKQNQKNQKQKQLILFVKGIQHIISKEYVEFILGKVKKINQQESKLIIAGSFVVDQFFNVDVIIKYLLEFKDMLFRSKSQKKKNQYDNTQISQNKHNQQTNSRNQNNNNNDMIEQQQFFSICDELSYQDIQLQEGQGKCQESQEDQEDKKQAKSIIKQINGINKNTNKQSYTPTTIIQNNQPKIKSLLNIKHYVTCQQKSNLFMKQHYLFKDWTRVKHGGVACYNQVIVSQQKKLFKKVITKMGSSILKGNGILNLSLPVDLFKKQSQLTSIAKDFCFAPIFIQKGIKANSALQRVKYSTLQAISVGNLGISMQKPFNPILGQTMQCWIDNCPIYLQQISHHPPISAYYMVGRGYKIHGQVQSKISVGMNTAKGYSDRPNHIVYEDGTKMTMVYGKMLIKGMLFGEREFTFQDKIFVYDQTNHLFSQIKYGPRKRSKDPEDFISGKIYKVKQSFKNKFYNNNLNFYPSSQDIQSQLSSFEGIWTQSIKFDNKQYINFKTQLPYDLIDQVYPLNSNSFYRMDLLKLIQNKIQQAQKHKESMEEDQRKDRKLREKYKR